jgi:hypothetical protein
MDSPSFTAKEKIGRVFQNCKGAFLLDSGRRKAAEANHMTGGIKAEIKTVDNANCLFYNLSRSCILLDGCIVLFAIGPGGLLLSTISSLSCP